MLGELRRQLCSASLEEGSELAGGGCRSHAPHSRVSGKEIHWIDGASHVDLYDKKQYLDPAIEKLTGFFSEHLGQP